MKQALTKRVKQLIKENRVIVDSKDRERHSKFLINDLTRDELLSYIMHRVEWGRHHNPEPGKFEDEGLNTKELFEQMFLQGEPRFSTYEADVTTLRGKERYDGKPQGIKKGQDCIDVASWLQTIPWQTRIEAKLTSNRKGLVIVAIPNDRAKRPILRTPYDSQNDDTNKQLNKLNSDMEFCYIANRIHWGNITDAEQGKRDASNLFYYFVNKPHKNEINLNVIRDRKTKEYGPHHYKEICRYLQDTPYERGIEFHVNMDGPQLTVIEPTPKKEKVAYKPDPKRVGEILNDPHFATITGCLSTGAEDLVEYMKEYPTETVEVVDGIKNRRSMGRMRLKRAAEFLTSIPQNRRVTVVKNDAGKPIITLDDAPGGKIVMKTPKTRVGKRVIEAGYDGTRGRRSVRKKKKK